VFAFTQGQRQWQPTERNNEYTLKLSVKCNQNNYAKAQAIIAVQANFCVNSQTPHASKKERHKPYFLPHMITVALKLFQTTGGRETTPALRMTTKLLIKQTSFAV